MPLNEQEIDAEMAADWAAIQEKYAVEEPEIQAEPASVEVGSEVEPETDRETLPEPVRARDETGKFAKAPKESKDGKGESVQEERSQKVFTEAPSKGPDASRTPLENTGAADSGSILDANARDINRAPSTWKPTARAEWEKLPPAVRTEIHRRETDFLNGQSQLLPDAKFGRSVNEVVQPYRLLIESEGGTPERAIGDLLRTAAQLRMGTPQQKVQVFAQIAQQYGVDLRAFQPQDGALPQPQQSLQDPRVDQILAQMQQEYRQRAQQEQQGLEGAVTNWMDQKDPQGKPLRPYLGDVMTEMSALVPQIRQQSPSLSHDQVLQQAYERATWGNPEIRALLIQQQAQGGSQTRSADNQQRVREAKRASSVNVARRASLPSPGKPGSLDDTLRETARELGLIT